MLRVNTVEFDESLSFSGKGAERSNFLLDMFLLSEKENLGFIHHYQKEPVVFKNFLDSILNVRTFRLDKFLTRYNDISPEFKEIATVAAYYDNYQRRESYPFSHYKKNDKLKFIKELPSDFYSFRESINLNNSSLNDLYSYQRYVNSFLDHEAYKGYCESQSYNTVSFSHNYYKIKSIEKYIKNTELKDRILHRTGRRFIENSNNKKGVNEIFTLANTAITSPKIKQNLDQLYNSHKKMEAGNIIPDMMLVNTEQRMVTLSSRIQKPTVLYFWSYDYHTHLEESHKKAKDLQSKYPEFNFISINLNNETEKWVRYLKQHKFNSEMGYRFDNAGNARKSLVINSLSKTIVLNSKGKILNSHANIHSIDFENELLAYLNQ